MDLTPLISLTRYFRFSQRIVRLFRSRSVLDDLFGANNKALTPDEKLKTGALVVAALDKIISISAGDQWKNLNKQLKKVEDKTQIKTILGL